MLNALDSIRKAGFKLRIVENDFEIWPASKLTYSQRMYITILKPEIMSKLRYELQNLQALHSR